MTRKGCFDMRVSLQQVINARQASRSARREHDRRRRLVAGLGALVLIGSVVTASPAVAAPAPAPGDFASSFEAADPQPATTTVELDGNGNPIQGNLSGTAPSGLPGSLLSQVTAVTASAENPPNEVAANLADGNPSTKWLAFVSSGWVTYQLAAPAIVTVYALTSANDSPGRDPKDFTLQGSNDGSAWTDLDSRTGQTFSGRFVTNKYTLTNSTAYGFYRLNITANSGDGLTQLADWDISRRLEHPAARHADGHRRRHRSDQRVQHEAGGRIHRHRVAALFGWCASRRALVRDQQALRRQRPGGPEDPPVLQDLPGIHRPRLAIPVDLCRGRPAFHRRQLPERAGADRSARLRADGVRSGRLEGALRRPVELRPVRHRGGRRGQDDRPRAARLRRSRRDGGHPLPGLDRRPQRPGRADPDRRVEPDELRRHPPGHQRVRVVLARQQPPDHGAAQRVQLLHPGDRRPVELVGVHVPGDEQLGEYADAARTWHLARAEPVDG